jgi:hypothetical protein
MKARNLAGFAPSSTPAIHTSGRAAYYQSSAKGIISLVGVFFSLLSLVPAYGWIVLGQVPS